MTLPGACLYCLQKRLNAGAACYAEICSGIIIRVHCRAVTWWHIVGLSHCGSRIILIENAAAVVRPALQMSGKSDMLLSKNRHGKVKKTFYIPYFGVRNDEVIKKPVTSI
ncbi:MAG: hypothetical protein IKW93_03340 [Bacteroidales bacterium]|nr:hypothetical protein [Bacteroidales bacterium]